MSSLLKTIIVVIAFFTYNMIMTVILNLVGITDSTMIMFISDVMFLIFVLFLYGKVLMKDIKDFHKSHKIWKRIGIIVAGVVILFLVTNVVGIILDSIFPNATVDENTTTLYSLNTVYTIFKALIFSVIAEELVFRKSISEVIDNKVAFVIISSIVYSATNIIYSDLSNLSVWINAIIYLCTYLTLSIIYVKNKDNIYPVMVMKFVLNLFPVIILLSGV